jgi:hypothetical protein
VLTGASEYDELPVRHNEDVLNTQLAREVRLPVDTRRADDPHIKAHLLLQVGDRLQPNRHMAIQATFCSWCCPSTQLCATWCQHRNECW